ncbi:hypothetical protein Bca52824_078123 [Brassica carinata]|uniref:Uncharacterized protein n=1 Tax=Brassica carinata TaxID=52824 RepID=A0A8X7PUW1_BRACI|nr:hypothetical protein Bca52824_078123 [Brassica carinata]
MWSSIENLKENLNKIALDVHDDDEDEEDLHSYSSSMASAMYRIPIGGIQMVLGLPGPFRGIRSPTESNRLLIMRKQRSVTHRLQKSLSNLKTRSHMSNGKGKDIDSQINEKDLADMLEDRTKSLAAVQAKELAKERSESFKEELQSLRLDKNKESPSLAYNVVIICRPPWRLAKSHEVEWSREPRCRNCQERLKEANKALEKENNELKKWARSCFGRKQEANSVAERSKESFPRKEELEKSLKRLETDLKEAKRERDKARQELNRLKQHLLEKETEESEKMDEDSQLIEELRQTNEYQRSQICLQLENT